nr:hypothetical protein [Tanacetum cinerariifolium]
SFRTNHITYYCWVNVTAVEDSDRFEQIVDVLNAHPTRKPTRKDTQVPQPSGLTEFVADEIVHKALGDRLVKAATTASSLEAEHDSGGGPCAKKPWRILLLKLGLREYLNNLMIHCSQVTKTTQKKEIASQRDEIASLKRRVKKLEKRNKSRTYGLKRLYKVGLSNRVELSSDEESLGEGASKQGRRINAIDADEDMTLSSTSENELTNQAMLESKAYKTYYAFPSGEKTSKPKYVRKKADFITSPKQKSVQGTKGTRIKTKAKVAKSDEKKQPAKKPKANGLAVLSKSKVPDEQQQKTSGTDEGTDSDEEDDDEDELEDDADNNNDDSDDNDERDDERMKSDRDEIPDPNKTNEEHDEEEEEEYDDEFNIEEDEKMDEEEDDEVTKELYKDVNVNLGNKDADMTDVDQGLTQSSSVSFDFTSNLLNLDKPSPADNEIASLIDTTADYATTISKITSSFTTPTPPPLPFFDPQSQQATLTPTPTASETTTSLPTLLDFAFVFKFNERVSNLEKDLSEMKQVDQYDKTLSSIPAIVDRYIDNKLEEAINKAIQAHNFDCREEAQAKKREYIELVDSTVRIIIKEEVNTQLSQILPQAISDVATPVIEKNVTESLEAVVLTRSSSQPQSSYEAAATLFEFKLTKILIDKMEKNKSFDIADYKRELYDALVKSYNTDKDIFELYGEVFSLKRSRDDKDKDQDPSDG